MSQNAKTLELDQYDPADDETDFNIEDSDYGFIVSANGELKTFFCPDAVDGYPPKAVQKIFKIFKINDLREIIPQSTMIH